MSDKENPRSGQENSGSPGKTGAQGETLDPGILRPSKFQHHLVRDFAEKVPDEWNIKLGDSWCSGYYFCGDREGLMGHLEDRGSDRKDGMGKIPDLMLAISRLKIWVPALENKDVTNEYLAAQRRLKELAMEIEILASLPETGPVPLGDLVVHNAFRASHLVEPVPCLVLMTACTEYCWGRVNSNGYWTTDEAKPGSPFAA